MSRRGDWCPRATSKATENRWGRRHLKVYKARPGVCGVRLSTSILVGVLERPDVEMLSVNEFRKFTLFVDPGAKLADDH